MPNLDYPGTGLCSSCVDDECVIVPTGYTASREVMTRMPEGYTLTLIKDIMYAFPDKFESIEEATMLFNVMKTVIVNGLKNGDSVHLEGLGTFNTEGFGKNRMLKFKPERVLCDAVNE